jgi:hypothetical protein
MPGLEDDYIEPVIGETSRRDHPGDAGAHHRYLVHPYLLCQAATGWAA